MTWQDTLVQLGALMATLGAMLGVWALLAGRVTANAKPRRRTRRGDGRSDEAETR